MTANIKFHTNYNLPRFNGWFTIYGDTSLTYATDQGNYAVLLDGYWAATLLVDAETGCCQGFESLLQALKLTPYDLKIPEARQGRLFISSNEEMHKASGCDYIPYDSKIYCDKDKKILCFGDVVANGEAIEFARGLVAIVCDEVLKAVYLNLAITEFDALAG